MTTQTVPQYRKSDLTNCLDILKVMTNNPTLRQSAMDLTLENFSTLYLTPGFLRLPISTVVEILQSNDLNVPSEEEVFKAAKLWANDDIADLKTRLFKLLKCVRLTLLPMEYLVGDVLPYCTASPESIVIVNQALKEIESPNPQNAAIPRQQKKPVEASKLIIVGSWLKETSNFIESYDSSNNVWTESKNYGFNRICFSVVLVDNKIMIIGGLAGSNSSKSVDCIDLTNGNKSSLASMNTSRFNAAAVTLTRGSSTDVYVIGGFSPSVLKSVEKWNSHTQTWATNVADMILVDLSYHSAAVIDGKIYVTGGDTTIGPVNKVQMYTPESNTWSYRAPMAHNRFWHFSAAIKGKLYVVGGSVNYTFSASVESYDPNSNLWTPFCTLPSPRCGCSVCLFNDKFVFIGGQTRENEALNEVLEYDHKNNTWNHLGSIQQAREGTYPLLVPASSII